MRNNAGTKIERILALAESLHYFTPDDIVSVEKNKIVLKIYSLAGQKEAG